MRRRRLLLLLLPPVAALVAAGCGNERTEPPDLSVPLAPRGEQVVRYPDAGLRFRAPGGWRLREGRGALVVTVTSGTATVAIWRYPRSEPLPSDAEALKAARRRLLAEVRDRDPGFDDARTRSLRIGDARAIEVAGTGTVGDVKRALRSTHVFDAGAEVVVDAYAPPEHFDRVDREVFRPLARSLRIGRPKGS